MKPYRIEFIDDALEQIEEIPHRDILKVLKAIRTLARDPKSVQIEKMKTTHDDVWRMRVDKWRVFFRFIEPEHIVRILGISDRKDAY